MLFEQKSTEANANDPTMINPKGFKIIVPESRVSELLKQGFTLVDKKWKPSYAQPEPSRNYPKPLEEMHQEIDTNLLEVTEL